jgi:AcrR family transcriptional regulator
MTVGNLYIYFDSKQRLWNAIINEYFSQFTNEIMEILTESSNSAIDIFDKIAKMFFSFATSDPNRFKMMFFIPPPSSVKSSNISGSIDLTFIDLIRGILVKAIENGELKEEKVDFYANLFGAIGIGSILMISPELGNFGGGFTSEQEKEEFLEFTRKKLPFLFN